MLSEPPPQSQDEWESAITQAVGAVYASLDPRDQAKVRRFEIDLGKGLAVAIPMIGTLTAAGVFGASQVTLWLGGAQAVLGILAAVVARAGKV